MLQGKPLWQSEDCLGWLGTHAHLNDVHDTRASLQDDLNRLEAPGATSVCFLSILAFNVAGTPSGPEQASTTKDYTNGRILGNSSFLRIHPSLVVLQCFTGSP